MKEGIIYIISMALQSLALIFYIKYSTKYSRQNQENLDPHTKRTLNLIMISLILKLGRIIYPALLILGLSIDNGNSGF